MGNKREMLDDLKEEGKYSSYDPINALTTWWKENIYFHYGKDGPKLDTADTIKNVALGPTVEWGTDNTGNITVTTTDPLHGTGTKANTKTLVTIPEWHILAIIAGAALLLWNIIFD